MARSHIAIALSAILIACLILAQLVFHLGSPALQTWQARLHHSHHGVQQDSFLTVKQSGDRVDEASSYLVGVGKADITGLVGSLYG